MPGAASHAKSLTMADFAGTVTVFNSAGQQTTIAATDLVRPSNWNSALNVFVTLSGNTAGQSTLSGTNILLAGGPNITLSAVSAGGGGTVTISGGDPIISRFTDWGMVGTSQLTNSHTQGNASFRAFSVPSPISFTRIDIPIIASPNTTTNTRAAGVIYTALFVIYSNNASTLSPIVGGSTANSFTWASNSANWSSLSGAKFVSFPVATVLTIGEYFAGFQISTQSTSTGGNTTALPMIFTMIGNVFFASGSQWNDFGNTSSASTNLFFAGVFTNTITATNQTIAQSNISATGIQWIAGNVPLIFRNY